MFYPTRLVCWRDVRPRALKKIQSMTVKSCCSVCSVVIHSAPSIQYTETIWPTFYVSGNSLTTFRICVNISPIDVPPPPTIEVIKMVIRQIKIGEAEGPDNILAETLTPDIDITANMLHVLIRNIWKEQQLSLIHWKEG